MNKLERLKIKEEVENLKVQTRRKEKIKKEKINFPWVFTITFIAFFISFGLSFASSLLLPNVSVFIGTFIVVLFIFLGVLFDMIGVSVTTADEKVFHSMNSRKVKGADIAVLFKKNADKVASFCNDVIGDICGVISGSAGVTIAANISNYFHVSLFWVGLIITALVASLTIGGKALGKSFAINKSNIILYEFAKFISNFYKKKR